MSQKARDVLIGTQRAKLTERQVIGQGGEATVFQVRSAAPNAVSLAVKLYLTPTPQRAQKLEALAAIAPRLPTQAIAPQALVKDAKTGSIIGFAMRLLEPKYTEIRSLSNRSYRAANGITARFVAALFAKTHPILAHMHSVGLIVGDLNDLNLMFHMDEMLFVDVDSFQFGSFPCPVATEQFLAPELYGVDLAAQPIFTADHDWYAYAVQLFKALLMTHPYGGVHPTLHTLTARAAARVSVLDSTVQYPRIAHKPELLSDDLLHVFHQWFSQGQRGIFPLAVLHTYLDSLITCPACGAAYPSNRAHCPVCAVISPVPALADQDIARAETLLHVGGKIVYWQVSGRHLAAIAYENGKAVLHRSLNRVAQAPIILFDAPLGAQYAIFGAQLDKIAVAPTPERDMLLIVDVASGTPKGMARTTTGKFGGTQPMFAANAGALYRIAGGYLLRAEPLIMGDTALDDLAERPIMPIAEDQTWFCAAPNAEWLFGYYRTLNTYQHWMWYRGSQHEVNLPPLADGERLIATRAVFEAERALIVRLAASGGAERCYVDQVDQNGRLLHSKTAPADAYDPLEAFTYANGYAMFATDGGVLREEVATGARKVFQQLERFTRHGDALAFSGDELLLVREDRVLALRL